MSGRNKEYQVREGKRVLDRTSLLERLRRGVRKIYLEKGVPKKGTGKYSIRNAQAAEGKQKKGGEVT